MPSATPCPKAAALYSHSPPIRSSPEPRAFQQSAPPRAAAHSRYPALPIVTGRQPRSLAGCKYSVSPSSSISPCRSLAPSGGPAPPLGVSRCRELQREKLNESQVCSHSMSKAPLSQENARRGWLSMARECMSTAGMRALKARGGRTRWHDPPPGPTSPLSFLPDMQIIVGERIISQDIWRRGLTEGATLGLHLMIEL